MSGLVRTEAHYAITRSKRCILPTFNAAVLVYVIGKKFCILSICLNSKIIAPHSIMDIDSPHILVDVSIAYVSAI